VIEVVAMSGGRRGVEVEVEIMVIAVVASK
jgi:hypothetical protein